MWLRLLVKHIKHTVHQTIVLSIFSTNKAEQTTHQPKMVFHVKSTI